MSTLLLDKLLEPASIVVIGASARESSPGLMLTKNLLQGGYSGKLFLVNPRYDNILGQTCFKSVKAIGQVPDLALIITPSSLLRKTLVQCSRVGIQVAVVYSGTEKSQALHRYAQRLKMRLMGPYCAGFIRPHMNLNATYSANKIHKGNLAIISQSASLGAAMVDWAESSHVGFSALLSTGSDTDISLPDLLDLLAKDWQTKAIIVYVEHINASREFISALSATARIKPVVLMRSSSEGVQFCDALSRTGKIYNSDNVFQAALNRAGVVRIRTFSNLYAAARILSTGIRVKGHRLAIISNANAPAMMAMEHISDKRLAAPTISHDILNSLQRNTELSIVGENPLLIRNPEDLSSHYKTCIEALQSVTNIDALLVIFTPDARNDPDEIARVVSLCKSTKKPLLACWMGDASVVSAREILSTAGIPNFRTPEAATDGFDFLHRYHVSQQQLLQFPNPTSRTTPVDTNSAKSMVKRELLAKQRVLGPLRTKALMELFSIPVLKGQRATNANDALDMAKKLGYPVAMKLVSPNISYKASVITTQLNISSDEQVIDAWERIAAALHNKRPSAVFSGVLIEPMHTPQNPRFMALSITRDSVFGPIISVSIGGELTALMHERRVQLPPLNRFLIDDIINTAQFNIYLGKFRHTPALDSKPLAEVLRRVSELACELPEVFSLDINPLVISEAGAMAMDVQVVLEKPEHTQRYRHLAIHPFPWQWIRDVTLKDNSHAQLRPIRPEDARALQEMIKNMSAESRYFRFMHTINELSPRMMAQFTKLDYDRQMCFVATTDKLDTPRDAGELQTVIGSCRYITDSNAQTGEFAVAVSDDSAGKGLATQLLTLLMKHAQSQGLISIHGDVLRANTGMQALMRSLKFKATRSGSDHDIIVYSMALSSIEKRTTDKGSIENRSIDNEGNKIRSTDNDSIDTYTVDKDSTDNMSS